MISVVVPVYNEEAALPAFLEMTSRLCGDYELLFADGGSSDATLDILRRAGRRVVTGARGRGAQCHAGALASSGGALLFLHADVRVAPDAIEQVGAALARGVQWGCLTLRWYRRDAVYRFGEWVSNMRVRCAGIPFGDQGVFLTRALYDAVGGMPDMPLMEDYELALRLRARGLRPVQLTSEVWASPRRFEEGGPLRVALQMRRLRRLYRQGADPAELNQIYRDVREGDRR